MSISLAGRSPTCLRCLRRTLGSSNTSTLGLNPVTLTQVRGKKNKTSQPSDSGVVVRLLQDVPKFGRKDAIFRVERGRMRNSWYPENKAEYMTSARFTQLGLTRGAIGERDPYFGAVVPQEEAVDAVEAVAKQPGVEVKTISPERAAHLLETLLPSTLIFTRKPIQQQPPPPPSPAAAATPRSPLLAANAATSTGPNAAESSPSSEQGEAPATPLAAIFGSVSTTDIAAAARALLMAADAEEAGLIALDGPRDVRFVGLEDAGVDRVKTLGRWEVEISASAGAAAAGKPVDPVRKIVEVVAGEQAGFAGSA